MKPFVDVNIPADVISVRNDRFVASGKSVLAMLKRVNAPPALFALAGTVAPLNDASAVKGDGTLDGGFMESMAKRAAMLARFLGRVSPKPSAVPVDDAKLAELLKPGLEEEFPVPLVVIEGVKP